MAEDKDKPTRGYPPPRDNFPHGRTPERKPGEREAPPPDKEVEKEDRN